MSIIDPNSMNFLHIEKSKAFLKFNNFSSNYFDAESIGQTGVVQIPSAEGYIDVGI